MGGAPIGLSRDLAPKGVMRALVGQMDLAVWRSERGVLSAWENRCPHRGMRLSHGFVRGESLACAYHGWHFNTQGQCHLIPAHPELEPPKTICTKKHPVFEQAGVIWLGTNLDTSLVSLPENLQPVRSIRLSCSAECAEAAFLSQELAEQTMGATSAKSCSDSPKVIVLGDLVSRQQTFVLLQEVQPKRVMAHILAAAGVESQDLIRVSRWSEAVRRAAES